jgi:hypothetical protein
VALKGVGFYMKKTKKLILPLAIILVLVFVGGAAVNILNPNNRKHYKIYEKNREFYYNNYLSSEKIWLAYNEEIALIHEYKTTWGKTYIGLDIWKYINPKGDVILQPNVYRAAAFSEGLAAVIPMEGQQWGYMDINGNIVINPQFSRASMFQNGIASVYIEKTEKWILINMNGEYIQDLDEPLNWKSFTQADPKNDVPK